MSGKGDNDFGGSTIRGPVVLAIIDELNIDIENKPLEKVLRKIKSFDDNTINANAIIKDLNEKELGSILGKEGYILDDNIIKRR